MWPTMRSVYTWAPWTFGETGILRPGGAFCECPLVPACWWWSEFFCAPADLLSRCSISCWEKGVDVSNVIVGFLVSSVSSVGCHITCFPALLGGHTFRTAIFLGAGPLQSLRNVPFCPVSFPSLLCLMLVQINDLMNVF